MTTLSISSTINDLNIISHVYLYEPDIFHPHFRTLDSFRFITKNFTMELNADKEQFEQLIELIKQHIVNTDKQQAIADELTHQLQPVAA